MAGFGVSVLTAYGTPIRMIFRTLGTLITYVMAAASLMKGDNRNWGRRWGDDDAGWVRRAIESIAGAFSILVTAGLLLAILIVVYGGVLWLWEHLI